jgi:hypothetical protein
MPRAEERTGVMVRATLRDGGGAREACVLDVSTRGLLLTTARPPARGEFVEIAIGDSRLAGQVKWSAKRRFGIALRDRVSVIAFLEGGQGPLGLTSGQGAAHRRKNGLVTGRAPCSLLQSRSEGWPAR